MVIVTGVIIIIGLIIIIIVTEVFGMIAGVPAPTQVHNTGKAGAMIIINLAVAIIPIPDAIIALILVMVTIVMVHIMPLKYYIQIV